MTVLVIGGTGTVGSEVVTGLIERGVGVRCLTRYSANAENLPRGVDGCVGDLAKPSSLGRAFAYVESVFLTTPLSQAETEEGLNALAAAKAAGVKKIVYMSVPMPEGFDTVPHAKSKIPIEQELKASGIAYTILRPNNFFQNDYWNKAAIMAYDVYPQPVGNVGLNRIDSRDIADAAVNALLQSGFEGQEYNLHGSETLTGEDIARVYSHHFGRDIRYGGNDLEAWAKQAQHMMPTWMVDDMKIMYQYFQQHGLIASAEDLARQQEILGHVPRSFDDFVAQVAVSWKE